MKLHFTKNTASSALMFFVGLSALFLISCQKDSGGGGGGTTNYGYNSCGNGYVNSQYGCIPQQGCPAGQGYYMNQCVQATTANMGNCSYGAVMIGNQCLPANQQTCAQVGQTWNGQTCSGYNQQYQQQYQQYGQQQYYPYNYQMYPQQQYYYQPYYQQPSAYFNLRLW